MESSVIRKRKNGERLTRQERDDLIIELVKCLQNGHTSTYELAQLLKISGPTVDRLRPMADKIIINTLPDRNTIRALEIQRTYRMIEKLSLAFDGEKKYRPSHKMRMDISARILGFSKHLALITGLNVETKVNVNQKQLVITRAHPDAVKKALNNDTDIERIQIESEQTIKNL